MSKYKNPIDKPDTVTVTRWEYARLIEKSTILNILTKVLEHGDKYKAMDVLEIMSKNDDEIKGVV